MSTIGKLDLEIALAHKSTNVLEGNWQVAADAAAGTITFTVSLVNPSGLVPRVGAADAVNFSDARILFWGGSLVAAGALNRGFSTEIDTIASSTATGTLVTTITLKDAVPAALTAGDTFTIYRTVNVSVTAPENISEVGGVGVPVDFAGNPVVPTTGFDQLVQDATVGAAQIGFIASGTEVAYVTATVDGIYRVNGALYCRTLVVNLGGTLIVGDSGQITSGAF